MLKDFRQSFFSRYNSCLVAFYGSFKVESGSDFNDGKGDDDDIFNRYALLGCFLHFMSYI